MMRTWGSSPFLFPIGLDYWPKNQPFVYTKIESLLLLEVSIYIFSITYSFIYLFI